MQSPRLFPPLLLPLKQVGCITHREGEIQRLLAHQIGNGVETKQPRQESKDPTTLLQRNRRSQMAIGCCKI